MRTIRKIKNLNDLKKLSEDFERESSNRFSFPCSIELVFNKVEEDNETLNTMQLRQSLIKQIHAGCHYLWSSDLTPFNTEKELMYHLKNKAGMIQNGDSYPLQEETILVLKELINRGVFITKDANFLEELTKGKTTQILSCTNATIDQLSKLKAILINDMINLYRAENDPQCQRFLENENYRNQL